jgi:hypothetical protein
MVEPYESAVRRGGAAALRDASRFFMHNDPVYQTLTDFARRLEELRIPYAIAGGMALVAHGYRRTTEDVDVLVSPEGLAQIQEKLTGLGYRPVFAGSKNLRNTSTGVRVEFIVTGQFPGDGKPKPVAFPNPADVAVEIDGIKYLSLEKLIELKLASGMTNPGRLRDLADVQDLVSVLRLAQDFAFQLNPFVRPRFLELLNASGGPDE